MDLNQRKLHKQEWNGIERPVSQSELTILKMIVDGYQDVNIYHNTNKSILSFLKIQNVEQLENYIYFTYFHPQVAVMKQKIGMNDETNKKEKGKQKLNSADKIRFEKYSVDEINIKSKDIYEFVLLHYAEEIVKQILMETKMETTIRQIKNAYLFHYNYYTLFKLSRNRIYGLNSILVAFILEFLDLLYIHVDFACILRHGSLIIERNEQLLKYADKSLYDHQKQIFTIYKQPGSKLTLYMAPTGTGKTLTPIGLCEDYRILFVCAARHVGLSLARAAISVNKKVAFAFGCETADDIRLHFFAAKEYTKNKKTGGIGKVDNSVGDNVQIMICDIKSYLPAMYYMMSFFAPQKLLLYWDEPTITLDCPHHEFHEMIHNNWKENLIPNIVLSSATLPSMEELTETLSDFMYKFANDNPSIHTIHSDDCIKSIPIVDDQGFVFLPHYLPNGNLIQTKTIAQQCLKRPTLLRYLDLKEICAFIHYYNIHYLPNNKLVYANYFENIQNISMATIKTYYIQLLLNLEEPVWGKIYEHFNSTRTPYILNNDIDALSIKKMASEEMYKTNNTSGQPLKRMNTEYEKVKANSTTTNIKKGTAGMYVTTKDAYTITDGPAIFFAEDIEKIAKFYIQQANIPLDIMNHIMQNIEFNHNLTQKIDQLEDEIDFQKEQIEKNATNSNSNGDSKMKDKDCKKINRMKDEDENLKGNVGNIQSLTIEVNALRAFIKTTHLPNVFIPNKKEHLERWAPTADKVGPFTSQLDEHVVKTIMGFTNVSANDKILLMLGIGVFKSHANSSYMELMKQLADDQKLFMIVASTDYIYGMNYQYCHGFLGKDVKLTQEKLIQALGRIGRRNIQQKYTIRIRENAQIYKLFTEPAETIEEKPEVYNMNRLFVCI